MNDKFIKLFARIDKLNNKIKINLVLDRKTLNYIRLIEKQIGNKFDMSLVKTHYDQGSDF